MLHFRYSTLINAPVDVVWKFHERSDILQILTPPWQPVQIIRHQGGLEIGAISEFIIWIFFSEAHGRILKRSTIHICRLNCLPTVNHYTTILKRTERKAATKIRPS